MKGGGIFALSIFHDSRVEFTCKCLGADYSEIFRAKLYLIQKLMIYRQFELSLLDWFYW